MKGIGLVFFLVFLPFFGDAQTGKLDDFVARLKAKNYSSDIRLLKKTLTACHKEFLKKYKAYSTIDDAFTSGNFDCLSGTLLISSVLDRLNIPYKIYETNYHIFLIVSTSGGDAIVETTDKNHGLIIEQREVESRLKVYKDFGKDSALYLSQLTIFNQVNREQMEGLVLFNQSVSQYLHKNFGACVLYLEKAKGIYNSPRIAAFSKILLQQIALDDMELGVKEDLMERLKSIYEEKISIASLAN